MSPWRLLHIVNLLLSAFENEWAELGSFAVYTEQVLILNGSVNQRMATRSRAHCVFSCKTERWTHASRLQLLP